jgi:glucose/arabinose dehydrogenase
MTAVRLMLAAALGLAVAACSKGSEAQSTGTTGSAPVRQDSPNGRGQTPAFAGQTRAPETKSNVSYQVTTAVEGLDYPWAIAFLPDGRMLVSERTGQLRIAGTDGKLSAPVAGVPKVDARGQGGLLGLALDPKFAENRFVYFSYSEPVGGGRNHTAVARAALSPDGARLSDVKVIFRQTPSLDSDKHYGSRLVFARDGTLFVTLGERSNMDGRVQAQRMDGTIGKVVRINSDGSVPKDNPFVGKAGARPEIFSIGHRNIQAAALNPATGELWEVEHGARGGDELNIVRAGRDYGWPTITYGIEYMGGPIGDGLTAKASMEQPVYYWDPVIAPSGMAFYTGDLFPAWKGSLFVGGLTDQRLTRLVLSGDKVVGEERLLEAEGERIRDVIQGPDGALYIATDADRGRILKLTPK